MAGPMAGFVPVENEPIPDFRPQKLILERPTIDRDAGGRRCTLSPYGQGELNGRARADIARGPYPSSVSFDN